MAASSDQFDAPMPFKRRCSDKVRYSTLQVAVSAAHRRNKMGWAVVPYHCRGKRSCGGYHIGTAAHWRHSSAWSRSQRRLGRLELQTAELGERASTQLEAENNSTMGLSSILRRVIAAINQARLRHDPNAVLLANRQFGDANPPRRRRSR